MSHLLKSKEKRSAAVTGQSVVVLLVPRRKTQMRQKKRQRKTRGGVLLERVLKKMTAQGLAVTAEVAATVQGNAGREALAEAEPVSKDDLATKLVTAKGPGQVVALAAGGPGTVVVVVVTAGYQADAAVLPSRQLGAATALSDRIGEVAVQDNQETDLVVGGQVADTVAAGIY